MAHEFSAEVRGQVLTRDLNRCVRCGRYLPEGAHLHHRKLRSQGGPGAVENGITLCAGCHRWVHQFILAARASGLIVPSWADPEASVLFTWRGPMLLTVDGGYTMHSEPYVPSEW